MILKEVTRKASRPYGDRYRLDDMSLSHAGGTMSTQAKGMATVDSPLPRPADGSNQSILGETNLGGNGILQTHEVKVEYDFGDAESQTGRAGLH